MGEDSVVNEFMCFLDISDSRFFDNISIEYEELEFKFFKNISLLKKLLLDIASIMGILIQFSLETNSISSLRKLILFLSSFLTLILYLVSS